MATRLTRRPSVESCLGSRHLNPLSNTDVSTESRAVKHLRAGAERGLKLP